MKNMIMRKKALMIIILLVSCAVSCGGGGGGGGGSEEKKKYTVSGTVTLNGVGLPGVTMTLHYSDFMADYSYSESTTTNAYGNYSFHVNSGFVSITASKYGYKFGSWGTLFMSNVSDANIEATSCLEECPVISLDSPSNNFVIQKSNFVYGIWDNQKQAVLFSGNVQIDYCGGASSVDYRYFIDGNQINETHKTVPYGQADENTFLCWDGDHPQNCEPIQPVPVKDNPISGNQDGVSISRWWRYPSLGSHTWAVQATNLYSGCTVSSETRTLHIEH